MAKQKRVESILYYLSVCLFMIGTLFQDFRLTQIGLGKIGACPSVFLIPVWFLASWSIRGKSPLDKPLFARFVNYSIMFNVFVTITTIVLLIADLPIESRGQNLAIKALKVSTTFACWFFVIYLGAHAALNHSDTLGKISIFTLSVTAVLVIIEMSASLPFLSENRWYHYSIEDNQRMRLLTSEASALGALLTSLSCLVLILVKQKITRYLTLLVCISLLIVVNSRGAILTFGIAVITPSLHRLKFKNVFHILAYISLNAIVFYFAYLAINGALESLDDSLDKHYSVATRSVFSFSMLTALRDAPFGGGWSGYLVYGAEWLTSAISMVSYSFTDLSMFEINTLITSPSDEAFAPKNLVGTLIWWGGISGLLYFAGIMNIFFAAYRNNRDWFYQIAIIGVIVSIASYETSLYQYSTPLLIGVILVK
jgi:hypothetical protein